MPINYDHFWSCVVFPHFVITPRINDHCEFDSRRLRHTEQLIPKFRQTQHIPTLDIGTSLRYLPRRLDVVQYQGIVRQLYHVVS